LIAAGGVFGLLAIVINLLQDQELSEHLPHWLIRTLHLPWPTGMFAFGQTFMPQLSQKMGLGVFLFVALAITLFVSARKKLKQS